ncbi:hypothetical protein CIHG_02232 [Coccidioides immitis H538.4]|uniref:Uncharacterized protein n=1 Tax=Coccidioides immitis H538.4 TaxID=396776 RepID=A0A0J8RHT1_COCIT|nr:hypothetical protein CIHG_02232 [Coccidioides immitis H538.4]
MATKKDMRRADLADIELAVVPYVDPASKKKDGDMASALSSTLPMAADDRMDVGCIFTPKLDGRVSRAEEELIYTRLLVSNHVCYGGYCSPNHLPWQMDGFQQANAISQDLRSLIPTSSSGKTGQGGSHVLSHPSSIVQIQCFNNENVNNVGFDEFYLDLGARAIIPTLYI